MMMALSRHRRETTRRQKENERVSALCRAEQGRQGRETLAVRDGLDSRRSRKRSCTDVQTCSPESQAKLVHEELLSTPRRKMRYLRYQMSVVLVKRSNQGASRRRQEKKSRLFSKFESREYVFLHLFFFLSQTHSQRETRRV